MIRVILFIYLGTLAIAHAAPAAGPDTVPVGAAAVDITPDYPIRLMGYEARKTESEGVASRLHAKALAIGGDAEGPAVVVAVDNCAVPARVVDEVAVRLKNKAKLPRERFVVSSSHTHCGPALVGSISYIFGAPVPVDQQERIDRYTRELTDALERVALAALADRKPARLSWAKGSVGFAANRRVLKDGRWIGFGVNPRGPVDHSLPLLCARDPEGKVVAVLAGYACHGTTLGGEFNKICGEWSGYAGEAIERAHPGAVALVVIGCGADANPEPRGKLSDAQAHGNALARAVERLLNGKMTPLPSRIAATYRTIDLPFGPLPTRARLAEQARRPDPEGRLARAELKRLDQGEELPRSLKNYPIQTWCFGDALALVFLGGEVVVDYALRLNDECAADRLWVVAYSNDVPCYIASKRILSEGGYEADFSMIYYGRPARLAPEAEDRIIETVHELLPDGFDAPAPKR